MSSSFWKKFLIDAGIPLKASSTYANAFVDNRLTENMIPDLNKSILTDLGITIVGDIIAILKHTIHITEQNTKKLALAKSHKVSDKSKGKMKNDEESKKETKSKESRSKSSTDNKNPVSNVKPISSESKESKAPPELSPTKQQADKVVQCESKSVQATSNQGTSSKSTKVLGKRKVNLTREVDEKLVKTPPDSPIKEVQSPLKLSAEKIVKKVMAFTATDHGDSYDESYDEDDEPVGITDEQDASETESDLSGVFTRHVVSMSNPEILKKTLDKRVVLRSEGVENKSECPRAKRIVRKLSGDYSYVPSAQPRITRVVTPAVQTVRCVSPDSTTGELFPGVKKQKTTVLINQKLPSSKSALILKSRSISEKTDDYRERIILKSRSKSSRYKITPKKDRSKVPEVRPEEMNSFRSDGESKKIRDFNKFRSENDNFEHISDDDRSKSDHRKDTTNLRNTRPMSERLGKPYSVSRLRSDIEPIRISNEKDSSRVRLKKSIPLSTTNTSDSFLSNEKIISKSVFSRLGR